ncbi:hypothetical protein QAD02_008873 [Eretmocerus hayati]|uniref:Uncharacterized protein n=1 Tax=Eretmocerus hayati TaxID=131215 RepID=A0ACC2N949_9HYME|nr:hypothetical protein QAD02_008873 [Eretmocerus hayati]
MISSTEWYGFVIDSVTCTSNTFNLPYPDFELMDAIPYHNEFDLLLKLDNGSTSNSQRALRYHDDGQFTTDVAFSTTFEDHQRLKSVKPFDPSEGFYYISRMQSDNGLTFEKLSPEFDLSEIHGVHLMRSKPISPMAYSLSNEEISICGFELVNTTNMKCLITDVQFSLIRLDVVMSFPHRLDNLIVKSLGNGGALLIFRWAFNDNRTSGVYFLHLRDKGLARQPTEIVRYFRPVSEVYVMEMDGGKYCVTVVGESSFITRCISPTF